VGERLRSQYLSALPTPGPDANASVTNVESSQVYQNIGSRVFWDGQRKVELTLDKRGDERGKEDGEGRTWLCTAFRVLPVLISQVGPQSVNEHCSPMPPSMKRAS
jgi:hypothetical protein